jgi:hypothetical protein
MNIKKKILKTLTKELEFHLKKLKKLNPEKYKNHHIDKKTNLIVDDNGNPDPMDDQHSTTNK